MTQVKTYSLLGNALDWAVAKAECRRERRASWLGVVGCFVGPPPTAFKPSRNPAQGWPILNRAKISRTIDHSGQWLAYFGYNYADAKEHMQCHSSELVAGLRCFVAMRLGDTVDIPMELL